MGYLWKNLRAETTPPADQPQPTSPSRPAAAVGRGAAANARVRFGVVDPDKATDLKLTVTCLGGAVVYVNGKEIGRGFMPDGPIHPLTPATDLPIETYTLPDGVTPMAGNLINATPENRARGDARIRTFTLDVPPSGQRPGRSD